MVINAKEIMTLLGVSKSSAYRILNELNESLVEKEFRTIHGKTSRMYFFNNTISSSGKKP